MNSTPRVTAYADLQDYDLVLACQKRIGAAFNVLYNRYFNYVSGALRRTAPDLATIHDDMVQEVFIRVWKFIDKLRNPRAFKSWLNQLIVHVFYDELRKRPKDFVVSLDEPLKGADGDEDGASRDIVDKELDQMKSASLMKPS